MIVDRSKAAVFIACCLLAFLVSMVFLSGFWAAVAVRHIGYYLVAAAVGLFLFFVFQHPSVRGFFKTWGRGHRWGILVVLACAIYPHFHDPHTFFVQYDESVLAGVGKIMHEDRQAAMPTLAHYLNGEMVYRARYVDKRPILFPFLVSVVHDLTGYRPENSFVINGLAGLLLLGGIYALLARWFGNRYGILAVLLMLTLPLLGQNATGAGMDMFNVALIVLVLNLAANFVRQPDRLNLNILVFGLILLAQARYESILYLIPGALVILTVWVNQKRVWMTWPVAVAPLLLLSPLLSIRVFTSHDQFYQLGERDDVFFHLRYLWPNMEEAVFYFFQLNRDTTNSPLLALFGAISLVFCIMLFVRAVKSWFREPGWHTSFFPFLAIVLFNTVWALTNFWGQFTDPIVSRVTLPINVFFALAAMVVARECFGERPLPRWILVATVIWIIGYTLPSYARAHQTTTHVAARTAAMGVDFARQHTTKRDLFIAVSTLPYIVNDRAAVSAQVASTRAGRVMRSVELGVYDNIYVVMEFKYDQHLRLHPMHDTGILEHFELELLHQEWFRPHVSSRIFRVTGLREDSTARADLERLRQREILTEGASDLDAILAIIDQLP